MNILKILIRGTSYGFFPDGLMILQGLAIILNYGLICFCHFRYRPPFIIWKSLSVILALTLISYFIDSRLMGMSTVWSFMYGYTDKRNSLDNWGFCIVCLGVFVPYYLKLWPWSPLFLWVCNMSHIFSAFAGFYLGNLDRKTFFENRQSSDKPQNNFDQCSDLHDFESKLLNGRIAKKSAEVGGHCILNFDRDIQQKTNPKRLIIGQKYRKIWNCDKPDPELHILKKLWWKLGLNAFIHQETFQKTSDNKIIVNDCLKWHPDRNNFDPKLNELQYKSIAERTYTVTCHESKLSVDFQPWKINMTGLNRFFRSHAEKHMQSVLPKKSQIVFDSIADLD